MSKTPDSLSLASIFDLFFRDAPVLTKAMSCSVSVDRFHLTCPVIPGRYAPLFTLLTDRYRTRKLRNRGVRASVRLTAMARSRSAKRDRTLPRDPRSRAHHLDLQLFANRHGWFFHVQANGSYDEQCWAEYHTHLAPFLDHVAPASLSKVELAWDIPAYLDSVFVAPIKVRGRLCYHENGYYYGARASDYSLAVYDRAAWVAQPLNPWLKPVTRVETRIRKSVPVFAAWELAGSLERIGVYILPSAPDGHTLLFPPAWQRADTRARERFLERIEPFRLYPDLSQAQEALCCFALKVLSEWNTDPAEPVLSLQPEVSRSAGPGDRSASWQDDHCPF